MANLSKRIAFMRTCREECDQPIKTQIKGVIPLWLRGTLLRNGPGLQEVGADKYNHMFDGLALIHRFHITNGEVEYQNKFLRSDAYNRNIRANRIVVTEFGTRGYPDPCKTIWQRFMSYFSSDMTDNDNVNIYPIGDQLYAATETKYIRRIDANSLTTHEKVDLSQYLSVNTATAHPHIDTDGTVYNMGSSFGPKGKYNLIRIPNERNGLEKASIVCSIPMERTLYPSYYHSFSITDNYYIFIEQPLVVSVPTLTYSVITGKAYSKSLQWRPELMTRFHVIRRIDGQLVDTKYIGESFAFFHTINAYEDNNQIVLDICCYSDGKVINALTEQHMTSVLNNKTQFEAISEVRRFVLPLMDQFIHVKPEINIVNLEYTKASASLNANDSSIQLKSERLTPSGPAMGELPRINYRHNGKNYRFFYSISQTNQLKTQLIKFDIKTKQYLIWSEENAIPSEPVFVENPNHTSEDEGVILSSVLSELNETEGFLLVLDAKTFKELGRAQFTTKSSITGTFHGLFVQ